MKRFFLVIILVVFLFVAFETSDLELFFSQPTKLIFVGDIMLSRQIGKIIERENNPNFPFELIVDEIQNADIVFGNLENPVSDLGTDQGSTYSFRANPEVLSGLKWAGFDVVSLANNHILDWGNEALSDTMVNLNKYGIKYVGVGETYENAHFPVAIERGRQNFCLLAYSDFAWTATKDRNSQTVSKLEKEVVIEDIQKALIKNCDYVIVSIHWGNEYETLPMQWQKEFGHAFIDSGALMVIGHHPHVVQPVETYKNGLIAYSLGNFVFDQNFSEDTGKSLILEVLVDDSKIVEFNKKEVRFNKNFQPFIP